MNLINILQPIIIIFSAITGLLLGIFTSLGNISIEFVEFFLILLLFMVFLSVDIKQVKQSFLNVKYTLTSIAINFIITPILAFFLGKIFFDETLAIRIGILMLLVTPCTDWYLVFTKLAKGNVELNMSILPINLLLQVILLPVYLFIFFGSKVEIQIDNLINSILLVLFLPFVCATLIRVYVKNENSIKIFLSEKSDNLQLLFLCLAVIVMFASEGQNLFDNYILLLKLFIPLMCFFIFSFYIAKFLGKYLQFNKEDMIALHFTTLARNSPLALAIAVVAFPTEPLISLSLVIGPLIELPILSIVAKVLRS